MSKHTVVECIHWDPEVDPVLSQDKKKSARGMLIVLGALALGALAVFLWLLLGGKPSAETPDKPPVTEPTTYFYAPATTAAPSLSSPALTNAVALYDAQQYAQAQAALDQILLDEPENARALTYRGLCKYAQGQFTACLQDFTHALKNTDNTAEVLALRGSAYVRIGLYTEGVADLSQAISLAPGMKTAYERRAEAYDAIGRTDLAAADRMAALAINE